MELDNVVIRPAELADIDAIADIYSALWCGWLRRGGFTEDERLVARFNTVMQAQCSPIALVAEVDGKVIAACYVGVYDDGAPRTNPYWQQAHDELLEQATVRAQTADDNLEGSLFGDSREKATGNRFGASDSCLCQAGDEQSDTRNLSSLADGLVKRSPFRASAPRPCGGLAPRTR